MSFETKLEAIDKHSIYGTDNGDSGPLNLFCSNLVATVTCHTHTYMHTEISFRNLIESNLNRIVFTIFRLI